MNLTDAVRYLEAGDWVAAHGIVQADESAAGAWAHGIVHILEGDEANARYWYRRAGRSFRGMTDTVVATEIQALKRLVGSDQ